MKISNPKLNSIPTFNRIYYKPSENYNLFLSTHPPNYEYFIADKNNNPFKIISTSFQSKIKEIISISL